MGEEIPRRLKRFYREGAEVPEEMLEEVQPSEEEEAGESHFRKAPPGEEEDARNKTMELALQEVKRFKEQHKRLPKKEEYDQIAESIYGQLKEEQEKERILQRTERARAKEQAPRKGARGPAVPAGKEREMRPAARKRAVSGVLDKIRGLEVKDLFESAGKEKMPKAKRETEFGELSDLSISESGAGKELKLEEFEEKGEEEACPNCKNKTEEIIYCPGCGSAYCSKCAKKVEKLPDRTKYYCPKCGQPTER